MKDACLDVELIRLNRTLPDVVTATAVFDIYKTPLCLRDIRTIYAPFNVSKGRQIESFYNIM